MTEGTQKFKRKRIVIIGFLLAPVNVERPAVAARFRAVANFAASVPAAPPYSARNYRLQNRRYHRLDPR